MEQQQVRQHISVTWRGKTFNLEMNSDATLKDLGCELQRFTDVKADTLRLIVPQASDRSSKLLSPFSDEHSCLSLQETSFHQGKSIRMMGVPRDEVDEILHNAQANLRIAGFEDEEKRMRQRMLDRPHSSLKLPQGQYIFCDFRTLHIPGIELNPPASEALKRMHMLAADPGIVAIMNKHRWRVGIMTEMAPEGYVGVSPMCILGLNKNHGEEISLRLRTDDLKGFRKYDSIKRTLLHELAHMVYSEHDTNFYALDKQLNQEAAALDWTRSKSHTLSPAKHSEHYDEFLVDNPVSSSHKLGGNTPALFADARATSVAAAYQRLANGFTEPDDSHQEPEPMDIVGKENLDIQHPDKSQWKEYNEPDPDDTKAEQNNIGFENIEKPDQGDNLSIEVTENKSQVIGVVSPDIDESKASGVIQPEPDPDDILVIQEQVIRTETYEPDPDDEELQRIQDPVSLICTRLQKAIEMLKSEANPLEAASVLQTLFKIIRNLIEHPSEMKFKRIRKANPVIQRNVANYKAAMEILFLIGFSEDVVLDEIGKTETLLVLKRNDPGLLWLAKSSLETCIG